MFSQMDQLKLIWPILCVVGRGLLLVHVLEAAGEAVNSGQFVSLFLKQSYFSSWDLANISCMYLPLSHKSMPPFVC